MTTQVTTMKAIVQDRYGAPEMLRYEDVPRPEPEDGEALVQVVAASLNARDWHLMRGDPYLARILLSDMGRTRPRVRIRGTDFAGRVVAVGSGVTRFHPGDEVFGEADGAFAEYVSAPVGVLEPKPANLSFAQAAALPLAGNTALLGLRDDGQVVAGQRVLINGASGGVGTFAVQLGRALGAEVTAVCSSRNVELVRSLGATHVVDYTQTDFARRGERYHVVFDLVGNRSLRDLRRVLVPGGRLVLSGGGVSSGVKLFGPIALTIRAQLLARLIRKPMPFVMAVPSQANLAALRELVESGAITPAIDRTYPLHQAADAIWHMEVEHARAKVVLTV